MNVEKATRVAAAKPQLSMTTTARPPAQTVKVRDAESDDVAAVEPTPRAAAAVSVRTVKTADVAVATVEESEEDVNMDKQQAKLDADATPPAVEPEKQLSEGVATFNRDYMETVFRSASVFAKGCEALGNECMAYAQAVVEDGMETSKALMGCRSLDEAVEIQTGYVSGALDRYLAESAKLSELSVKLASVAIEPINSGFVVAAKGIARSTAENRRETP
jgi:hypothetical protein